MSDWTFECLRRALIVGAFTIVALISNAAWLKASSLISLVVFFFFLLRNPDGWARRIAYACAMLGTSLLVGLGSAIKATGWFDAGGWLENAAWAAGLMVTIERGSIWPGIVLLIAAAVFGGYELRRLKIVHATTGKTGPNVLPITERRFNAQSVDGGAVKIVGVLPIRSHQWIPVVVGHAALRPHRWLDSLLSRNIEKTYVHRLEKTSEALPPVSVEFTPEDPFQPRLDHWIQFDIAFRFQDRIGIRQGALRILLAIFGLNRRYFDFKLGATQGDVHTSEVILVVL